MHKLLKAEVLITFGILIISIIGGCGDDNPPEKVVEPPQLEADAPPPPTITVVVDPPPGSVIAIGKTEVTLWFSKEVAAVTVNGVTATGSGQSWNVWPSNLSSESKAGQFLDIEWKTRDGSTGSQSVGPYKVWIGHLEPPELASATLIDGAIDVDPAVVNLGLRYDFTEPVIGTIKLTDEEGADLNWIGIVSGQTATLTPVAGQELVNETTYKVEIDVQDGAGLPLQVTITFVTKPK